MAILDVFKKKDEEKKEPVEKAEVKVAEIKKSAQGGPAWGGEEKIEKPKIGKGVFKKEFSQAAARVLTSPHVTEKAIKLGQQDKYVFKVSPDANKTEVRKAVQELYGVSVMDVNIINIPRRRKRVGMREGFQPGFKKAVVTLKQGDKIDTGM